MDPLHQTLERLYAATDGPARLASDPVAFCHRYPAPEDVEIAGLIAVSLAYGRVDLFLPVLTRLFEAMNARGGPRAFTDAFEPDHAAPFLDLVYRWNRGSDFSLLFSALRSVLAEHGSLEAVLGGPGPVRARLERGVDVLRAALIDASTAQGSPVASFAALPRGVRYMVPSPSSGSACKRWNLYLRWMVRPTREGVDLGVWTSTSPAELLMPVDVHVGRIARFIGLTARTDASWRTVEEISARLRDFDADDPIRFDFALAHLGISSGCRGHRHEAVCPDCPLTAICQAPTPS